MQRFRNLIGIQQIACIIDGIPLFFSFSLPYVRIIIAQVYNFKESFIVTMRRIDDINKIFPEHLLMLGQPRGVHDMGNSSILIFIKIYKLMKFYT
jgi:hypothetical protein